MEQKYINMLRRWLWLMILTTVVASAATYWFSLQQTPVYETRARLIVGPGIENLSPDLNALRAGGQLMQTYGELATTRPVLQAVIDDLGLNMRPDELGRRISIKTNQETQILSVVVQHADPQLAAAIANSTAEMLVRMSPSGMSDNPAMALNVQMRSEVERVDGIIRDSEARISQLEGQIHTATTLDEQRLLMDELSGERARLSDAHRNLTLLYDALSKASTNQVRIIEPAAIGFRVDSQLRLKVMISALVGLVLGAVVALAFEYFDDSIKSADELTQAADVPLLGSIARHKSLRGAGRERLAVQALPESRTAENYRMLGTKLLFANGANRVRSVLLSSAQMSEDTGEIAANLAVILAQTGNRVVLVDANLNRPTIGQIFGIPDRLGGLTDVLTGQAKAPRLATVSWAPGLSILPSGPVSYDSFALLSSNRMVNLLKQLENEADIVIVTASPLLAFADSLILASRVDGAVIVARRGKARPDMVSQVVKSLRSLNAHIIGTVLDNNRILWMPSFFRRSAAGKGDEDGEVKEVDMSVMQSNGVEPADHATTSLKLKES